MMDLIEQLFDFLLHSDRHLSAMLEACGGWTYVVLFGIIFCETGLIVTPFLPGDSLLFAAGAFAGSGHLSMLVLIASLFAAAVVGDAINYGVGRKFGKSVLSRERLWLIRREHLRYAEEFFARHGGKAVVLARFTPIVRTFVPFVAGAGRMRFSHFMSYNAVGGFVWVTVCTASGYAFGHLPVVRENFSLVALGIVAVSIAPSAIGVLRSAYLLRYAQAARSKRTQVTQTATPNAEVKSTTVPSI